MTAAIAQHTQTRCTLQWTARRLLVCLVVLFAGACVPCAAMIDNGRSIGVSPSDNFFSAWQFEFAVGGTYDLTIELLPGDWIAHNTSIQILVATDAQLDPIRSASMNDVCADVPFNYGLTLWQTQLGANDPSVLHRHVVIPMGQRDWVRLLVLNCDQDDFQLSYSDVAMNPDGEYLSLSEVPYKMLFRVYVWIWAALAAVWIGHVWSFRRWNIAMQTVLTLLPLTKAALCIPSSLYWNQASSTGFYPTGLGWAVILLGMTDRVTWIAVIYLLASGWRLTKPGLSRIESRGLALLVFLLASSYFVWEIQQGFFVFLMLFCYILALRVIFSAMVDNGSSLLRQMRVLNSAEIDYRLTPLHAKLHMYKMLQGVLVAFVSIDVIFHLWAAIFLKNTPWVSDLMDHILSTLLVLCVGYNFALRAFNPFWMAIFTAQIQAVAAGGGAVEGQAAAAAADRIVSPPLSVALAGAEGQNSASRAADPRSSPDGSPRAAGDSEYHSMASSESRPLSSASPPAAAAFDPSARSILWRPGMSAPPASACLPQGNLASVWLRAAGAARLPVSAVDGAPVLVLECPLAEDGSAPLMVGTAVAAVPTSAEADCGVGAAAAAADQSAWGALSPAALPYLPAHMRLQMAAQARLAQLDSRSSNAAESNQPSQRAGRVHNRPGAGSSSSAARTRYSRVDSFPDHI